MELKGTINKVFDEQSGTSARTGNAWRRREYLIETDEKYPRKVCFSMMNDNIDKFPLSPGQHVTVSIDIESREHNGRWFTNVNAWSVNYGTDSQSAAPKPAVEYSPAPAPQPADVKGDDDLPF